MLGLHRDWALLEALLEARHEALDPIRRPMLKEGMRELLELAAEERGIQEARLDALASSLPLARLLGLESPAASTGYAGS